MATKKTEVVEIKPIETKEVEVTIIGDTPLIEHAWSEKAKKMMLASQQGTAKGKEKEKKSPIRDFVNSLYWIKGKPDLPDIMSEEECQEVVYKALNNAKFGFPACGLKQAAISAAYRQKWTKDKMSLRGVFFIESDENGLIEIDGTPTMREDMVRIGMGTADIRYRGEFKNWKSTFKVRYNANGEYDLDAILNIINAGGYLCGLGEWRVEKDGEYGSFHIATK